jgi:hypothetical protein
MKPTWRRWLFHVLTKRKSHTRSRRPRVQLDLELLENRTLPSGLIPSVLAINRATPVGPETNATSVSYSVTFNESVTSVAAGDFQVTTDGATQAASPVAVSGSGAAYTVTISGIHGSGDLRLDLIDNDTIQASGVPLGGPGVGNGSFQGQTYNILQADPCVVSINRADASPTNASTVQFTVTFSESVTGVNPTDFQVATTGTVGTTLTQVAPVSGSVYTVTVSGVSGNGTLGLNLVDNGSIHDLAGSPLTQPNAPASFQGPQVIGTVYVPDSVVLADVNGDGKADLIVGNYGASTVAVSLGNGNGTFQSSVTFATGANPRSVVLGHVNGDGNLDLVAANSNGNTVSVLLGNGNGTFQAQNSVATGSGPYSVALGDMNGDGIPDLAVANDKSNTVSVLLGNGNGTFQAQKTFVTGSYPKSVALADLNGDSKLDLAVGNSHSNTISVFLGNGNGTFQRPTTLATGSTPYSLECGDVNGDGIPDLAVANGFSYSVGVFLGNGNGTFQIQTTFAAGLAPLSVALGDVNGDGKLDFVTADINSSTVSVLLSNGNGTFQGQQAFGTGVNPTSVVLGDVNGDGKLDLAVATDNATVGVLLGNGDGTFQTHSTFATGSGAFSVALSDVNSDGHLDLAVANLNSNTVSVLLGNGNGSFQAQQAFGNVVLGPRKVIPADFNGDGKPDLAVVESTNVVSVLLGNGNGTFQKPQAFATFGPEGSMVSADFNGDGKPDIALANYSSSTVSVFLGNGNGTFQSQISFALAFHPAALVQGDVNGDRRPDLVVGYEGGRSVSLCLGNGNGTFQAPATEATGSDPRALTLGDIDGDGQLDLVTVNLSSLSVLLGNGNGTFQAQTTLAVTRANAGVPVLGDVNGDGKPDLTVSYEVSYTESVFLGNGDGTFQNPQQFSTGPSPLSPSLGDVNGDGRLDLVVTNYHQGTVSVLLNTTNGNFTGQTYTIDTIAPYVVSINRADANPTIATTVHFTVTFSEPVTGVAPSDFALALTGSVTATTPVVVSGSGAVYTVKVSGISGAGTLGLNLVDNGTIHDLAGNPLTHQNAPAAFQAQQTYATGSGRLSVVLGELTGDGTPDLVVANPSSSTVSVFLGNGNGTFQGQQTFATGEYPSSVAVGDVNGDGKPDLVVGSQESNSVSVLLGNGNGTFQAQQTFDVDAYSVALADLNGDGNLDLAVCDFDGDSVSVLLGNGNGTFQAPHTSPPSFVRGSSTGLAVVDVNGDDKPDLVVANSGGSVSVFLGNGNGTFQAPITFGAGLGTTRVSVGDLNGDGTPDLVVANSSSSTVSVFLGNGNGTFQGQRTFATGENPGSVALGDVNGNGMPDLAVANAGSNTLSVLLGNGNGTFQAQQTFATGGGPFSLALGDMSGDGRLDLAVGNGQSDTVSVLLNAGNGNFTGQLYTIPDTAGATHFVITGAPSSVTAGGKFTFTVTAEDSSNNVTTAYTSSVHFTSSDSQAVLPVDSTLVSGVGIFSATLGTVGSQTLTASDIVVNSITGTSGGISVSAAAASHFQIIAPATIQAGNFSFFTVTALDPFNNVATSYSGSVQFTTSASSSQFSSGPLSNGTNMFIVILNTAGTQTITATDTIVSTLTGFSNPIVVTPAALHQFGVIAPANVPAGAAFDFTVAAQDRFGNTVPSYTGTVNFTSSDTRAGLSASSTLSAGVGIFSATLGTEGSQTLIATDSVSSSITGNTATNVIAGAATHFAINIAGNAMAGFPLPFTVTAEDQFNNVAVGYTGTVVFSSSDGQAGQITPSVLTSGVGSFVATLKTAGAQTVFAADSVVNTITGSSSPVVVSPGTAAHFAVTPVLTLYTGVTSGPNSFATTGLATQFTVTAEDQFNNSVPTFAGTVTFSSNDTAAALPANGMITGGVGTFSATLMTAGNRTLTASDAALSISGTSSPFITRGLVVTSFASSPSGFSIGFNKPFNPGTVFLYTTGTTPDDVLLATTNTQISVRGTVLFNTTDTGLTFVKTDSITSAGTFNPANGLLTAGNYTLTLRSLTAAGTGFQDSLGAGLDGTNSGGNANFKITFSVSAPPVAVGIPDFARGPSNTDALFLPGMLSIGGTFALSYTNPAANPPTGTATITFSTTATTLATNIQTALTSGGLATQVGVNPNAGNTTNSVVIVTNDSANGANVLVTFQSALATATSQLLSSNTPGVSISLATINVANNVPGNGIPIELSSGLGVTSGSFTLQYNPALLTISGVVSKVAGASFTLVSNNTATGTLVLSLSSPSSLTSTATAITMGSLLATVPLSATASYGLTQLLHFSGEQLNGTAGPIAATNADGVQVAAYFGDVTAGGGPFVLGDSTAIFSVSGAVPNTTTQTIPGFAAFPILDPAIIGDVSLQGSVSSTDAGAMLQEVGGLARITIPYAPIGLPVAPPGPVSPPPANGARVEGELDPGSAAAGTSAPATRVVTDQLAGSVHPPSGAESEALPQAFVPPVTIVRDLNVLQVQFAGPPVYTVPDEELAILSQTARSGLFAVAFDLPDGSAKASEETDLETLDAVFADSAGLGRASRIGSAI